MITRNHLSTERGQLPQDELSANWDRARLEQPLVEIDPLP